MHHSLSPFPDNLHGVFSNALAPILNIRSGDSVSSATLDSRWHNIEQPTLESYSTLAKAEGRGSEDKGHALIGPIFLDGASPGDVVEIEIQDVQLANWGWSVCGGWSTPLNKALGIEAPPSEYFLWTINDKLLSATNQFGDKAKLNPFPGILGLAPKADGFHSTIPPRLTGGNLDCALLIKGSRLFLPVAVEGALISFGDGHAVQGNGEVGGVAIECPMRKIQLGFTLHTDKDWTRPRAITSKGRVTFAFNADLDVAWVEALEDMVLWLMTDFNISRRRAISLCSIGADLSITQVANRVCGVHCVWNGNVQIGND
jgi:acetamidase/formamidase